MKYGERKIGPKFGDNYTVPQHELKPMLYQDQINFDRMRMYRLNRVKEQLIKMILGPAFYLILLISVMQLIQEIWLFFPFT